MKNTKKKNYKMIAGFLVVLLVVGIVGAIYVGRDMEDKTGSSSQQTKPEQSDSKEENETTQKLPSSTVVIESDKQTSFDVEFPCEIGETGLRIEKLAPYSGVYLEDGTGDQVSDVAMILVHNTKDQDIEYAEICIEYKNETLQFQLSALPAGARVVLQEKQRKKIPSEEAVKCTAMVIPHAQMGMAQDQVFVIDNGNDTLTVKNLTTNTIPSVRIFYKHFDKEEHIFLGGIAFNIKLTELKGDAMITIQPAHYASDSCNIVMVATYSGAE